MSEPSRIATAKAAYALGSAHWPADTQLIVNGVALAWSSLSESAYFRRLLAADAWNDLPRMLERLDEEHPIATLRIGYHDALEEAALLQSLLRLLEPCANTAVDDDDDDDDDGEAGEMLEEESEVAETDEIARNLAQWSTQDLCKGLKCADCYNL